MDDKQLPMRGPLPVWIALPSLLMLAAPAPLYGSQAVPDKVEAAKVAKKVERAKGSARQAKEEQEALREFEDEVEDYAEFHQKQLQKLRTHVTGDAQEAAALQKALAAAITTRRAKAGPGDLFEAEVQPLFRRLIAEQFKGPDAVDARKAALDGNPAEADEAPAVPFVPQVNAPYPEGAPRSTVPPSVLLTLPALPEALQYRFVGQDLVLVDSVAQIIVDVLPGAAPDLK